MCRKLGALWAYYTEPDIDIRADPATVAYARTDGPDAPILAFHHCAVCGCTTHWRGLAPGAQRMGVNARLFPPDVLADVRVRRLDGADTWRYLDED